MSQSIAKSKINIVAKIIRSNINSVINFFFICGVLFHYLSADYMKLLTEFFLFSTVLTVLFFSFYDQLADQSKKIDKYKHDKKSTENTNQTVNTESNYGLEEGHSRQLGTKNIKQKLNNKNNQKLLLFLIITSIITIIIEILGVKTGLIFGVYEYGKTFSLKLFEVPVIIGLNWSLVILGSSFISQKWLDWVFENIKYKPNQNLQILKTIFGILLTGFLAVFLDYFLEPVAIKMDYWQWQNGVIPIQNYIAWLTIAIIFDILIRILDINHKTFQSKYFTNLFWIELLFFVCLNLVL